MISPTYQYYLTFLVRSKKIKVLASVLSVILIIVALFIFIILKSTSNYLYSSGHKLKIILPKELEVQNQIKTSKNGQECFTEMSDLSALELCDIGVGDIGLYDYDNNKTLNQSKTLNTENNKRFADGEKGWTLRSDDIPIPSVPSNPMYSPSNERIENAVPEPGI